MLDAHDNTDLADFFKLAIFTGARRGNLLAMAWKDIDLKNALWTIPAEDTKTGRTYLIPLADRVLFDSDLY